MIGDTISHYKVLEKLGEGGMGVVYKAEDSKLKRTVALKFLPPQTMASEEERDRFTREAQAAAALNHPNIATVFEINEDDGHNFIAMEYCEGESLKKKVSGGPLKITDAIDIAIQIADGLHAAHEQGVVHRDMKSANVMVNAKGQVKVMDFGLAKLKGVSLLTKQGTTLGTVAYMSPEQARGEKVDERTDIWSLGVVLYEMLSGRAPFEGDFEQSVLYAILNAEPEPITGVRSNVPMDLERCLNKMMAKDPADRYQHVQEIPVDLRAVRNQLKSSSTGNTRIGTTIQSPAKRKTPLPWLLTAAMAVLAGLALWAPWGIHQGHEHTMRFIETLPQGNMLDVVSYRGVDISADGTHLAYVMGGSLYIRTLENLKSTLLEGTDGAQSPFFSPDGRWIGFFSKGKLRKIPVTGGTPIALADAVDNRGGTWSPHGFIVYVPDATTGLMKIPETGGPPQQISFLDTLHHERTHRWPALLPDGNSVLFTVGDAESPDYYEDATIDLMDIGSGKRSAILRGASTARYIPDNTLVYTRSGVLFAVVFDPGNGKTTGTPVQVVQDVNGDATTAAMHYAFSQNGTLVYYPGQLTGGKMNLVRISIDGKEPQEEVLTDIAQPYAEPKISPDGTRVALVISSGKDQDIWVYNLAGRTLSRLTFGATNRSPAWSPDGQRIAFLSVRPSAGGIYAKPADGSGAEEELYQGRQRMYINSWTPDGSNMVLDIPGQKGDDLFVLNLREKKISDFISRAGTDEWQSSLSPDGRWIAYESNESGTYQVYVQQFPGKKGKWQITTAGAEEPRWSPDGRTIYYTTGATIMAIPVTTSPSFSAGQPRIVFSGYKALTNDTGIRYDITKDGKYIITTRPERENTYQQIEVVLHWFDDVKRIMDGK